MFGSFRTLFELQCYFHFVDVIQPVLPFTSAGFLSTLNFKYAAVFSVNSKFSTVQRTYCILHRSSLSIKLRIASDQHALFTSNILQTMFQLLHSYIYPSTLGKEEASAVIFYLFLQLHVGSMLKIFQSFMCCKTGSGEMLL